MVLRAFRPASRRMDGRGHLDHGGQGERLPPKALRGVLPVPSCDALRLPTQVARAPPIPADPRGLGDAGAVDFMGGPPTVSGGKKRAAHHPRLRAAARSGFPRSGTRPAGRAAPRRRHRGRHRRRTLPRQIPRRGHQGRSPGHPRQSGRGSTVRVLRRTDRQGGAPARVAVRTRRTRSRDDHHRQRRGGLGRARLLHPQGRRGRLPHTPPSDAAKGCQRPARLTR